MIVGGIGVCQIAADGRQIPNQRIGDHGGRVRQNGIALPDHLRAIDLVLTRHRADRQVHLLFGDAVQTFDMVDIDQVRRFGQTETHDRDQALTAGQQLSVRVLSSIPIASSSVRV